MAGRIWFGTRQHMQWVPAPAPGLTRRRVHAFDSVQLDRGGASVARSTAGALEWSFDFPVQDAHGDGLDVFQEYATGMWDDFAGVVDGTNPNDLIYWADHMAYEANLFPAHWATPALGLRDWPMLGTYVSNSVTPSNAYRHPPQQITLRVPHAAGTLPPRARHQVVIPIPPTHTLWWGWSGERSGSGVIRAEAHHALGETTLVQNAPPLPVEGSTRMSRSIPGDTYDYAVFGIARTSSTSSTVTIASLMAQLHPNGVEPSLSGPHIAGQGATGCLFNGDAIPETYVSAHPSRTAKGLSFGLIEVGAWL